MTTKTTRGPHPSFIQTAKPFIFDESVKHCLVATNTEEAKEDSIRLQGVAWIDAVRRDLQLPVKTYNTACVYFHKFRLVHAENEYNHMDAAAAALVLACKIEDTQKRTREILASAYNIKVSHSEQLSSDDQLFETPARIIVGLERLMLEASGFDFRSRHPQKVMLKLAKQYNINAQTVGKTAFQMSLDLYKTFAPLKQTSVTLAMGCLELAGRMCDERCEELETGKDYDAWNVGRAEVRETMIDLLDLYTHHRSSTIVGQDFHLDAFVAARIPLNQEDPEPTPTPRYVHNGTGRGRKSNGDAIDGTKRLTNLTAKQKERLPGAMLMAPTSATGGRPRVGPRGQEGTIRFMLNPDRARDEKSVVIDFFRDDQRARNKRERLF